MSVEFSFAAAGLLKRLDSTPGDLRKLMTSFCDSGPLEKWECSPGTIATIKQLYKIF